MTEYRGGPPHVIREAHLVSWGPDLYPPPWPGHRHCSGCRGFTKNWRDGCQGITRDVTGVPLEDVLANWARCNFDGRPVSPADMRAMADFAATLDARKDGAKPGLHWRELADDDNGPYWREWYCPQPPLRAAWRVLHDEWGTEDGKPVRRIYQIEIADAAKAQEPAERPAAAERPGPAGPGPGPGPGTGGPAGGTAPPPGQAGQGTP